MKNPKIMKLVHSVSYTFLSNLLTMLASMIVTLVVPKLIGVSSYGYFQLYVLYINFLATFHFGWVDGIYLRIGGKKYAELDPDRFSREFALFRRMEFIVGLIGIGATLILVQNVDKRFVFIASCVCMIIYNSEVFVEFILLATAEVRKYSAFIVMDRLLYLLFLLFFFLRGITSFRELIYADLLARAVTLVYQVYRHRRLLMRSRRPYPAVLAEIKADISSGYKVTIGAVAAIFITGIARAFIENKWGIKAFGEVSLSFTLSNLLMVFVNAVSLVLFPILKKTDDGHLAAIYDNLRTVLMVVLLGCLVFYQPIEIIVGAWLPKYAESLHYLALMFPIVIFDSKTMMLATTYFKSLRLEKYILISNLLTVAVSTGLSFIAVYWFENQLLAVMTIVVAIAFRSVYSEIIIGKHLDIGVQLDIVLELILSGLFMYVSWNLSPLVATAIYTAGYLVYLGIKAGSIKQVFKSLKGSANAA